MTIGNTQGATRIIYAARRLPLLRAVWNKIVPLLFDQGQKFIGTLGLAFSRFDDLSTSLALGLHVILESSVRNSLLVDSSSSVLPADHHWSKRQERKSLYMSGE